MNLEISQIVRLYRPQKCRLNFLIESAIVTMPQKRKKDSDKLSTYQASSKFRANSCKHIGVMPWDKHEYCISCAVWAQKGAFVVRLDDGIVRLPCIQPPYCGACKFWSDSKRAHYLKLVVNRCLNPQKYSPGLRFVEQHGFAAPIPLLEALDIPVSQVTPSTSEGGFESEHDSITEFHSQESEGEASEQEQAAPDGVVQENLDTEDREDPLDRDLASLQNSVSMLKQNIQLMEAEIYQEASASGSVPQTVDKPNLQFKCLHLVEGDVPRGDAQVSTSNSQSREEGSKAPTQPKGARGSRSPVRKTSRSLRSQDKSQIPSAGLSRYALSAVCPPKRTESPKKSRVGRDTSPLKPSRVTSETRKPRVLESPKKQTKRTLETDSESDASDHSRESRDSRKSSRSRYTSQSKPQPTTSRRVEDSSNPKMTEAERIIEAVNRVSDLLKSKSTVSRRSTSFKGKGKKMRLVQEEDTEPDIVQFSSDEDDSSRPTSSGSSVIVTKDQVESLVQKILKKNKIRVVDSEGEEEDKDVPNRKELLTKFKTVLEETISDLPECQVKEKIHRTSDLDMTNKKTPFCLPIHPTVKDTLDMCMSNIKEDTQGEPMGVGKVLTTTRAFPSILYDIGDLTRFPKPQKNSSSDLLPPVKNAMCTLSDKEMQTQEQYLREVTALWSQNMWAYQSLDNILSSDMETDMAFQKITDILNQQKAIAPLIQDRLSVLLSNITLRRRDMVLKQNPCSKMKDDSKINLRSSSLLQDKLFVIDKELREREEHERTTRDMMSAMKTTVTVNIPGLGKNFQAKAQPQAKQTQQKEPESSPAPTFQQPTTSTGYAGAQNFKAQRGRGAFRGTTPRGRGRGQRGGSRGRYNKGRGRGQFNQ